MSWCNGDVMSCLFCDFVKGEREKHENGFPFEVLNETENTVCFPSIDFPAHEEGHLLVIPKEHYRSLEDVPPETVSELIEHVQKAARVTRMEHEGCNVLLNNGEAAGQSVMHVHFHIVPRDEDDDIDIEVWDKKELSEEQFEDLISSARDRFKQIS